MSTKSVFLCHSHKDKPFARKLASDLSNEGVFVWLDEAEILVGDSLIEQIRKAIDDVDFVVAIISDASINSPWVQKELDVAMNQEIAGRKIKVLPVLRNHLILPGFLLGKLYADFTDSANYESSFYFLLKSINKKRNKKSTSYPKSKEKNKTVVRTWMTKEVSEQIVVIAKQNDLNFFKCIEKIVSHGLLYKSLYNKEFENNIWDMPGKSNLKFFGVKFTILSEKEKLLDQWSYDRPHLSVNDLCWEIIEVFLRNFKQV